MKIIDKITVNYPTWAICAWEYGEDEGLDPFTPPEDIKVFREFRERMEKNGFLTAEFGEDVFFMHYPEFGWGCDCVEATFYKLG